MLARLCLALAALSLCATSARAQDSTKKAALTGMVRDVNGHPLSGATVVVDDKGLQTTTSDSGNFFLGGIPAGHNDFTVAKLGYSPVHFSVNLQPDTTLMVNIPMRTLQALPGVEVSAQGQSAKLLMMGFYDRKKVGLGTFLDNDRIEQLSGALQPSSFLRDVRGVVVRCKAAGRCTVAPTRAGACLAVFVNKVYVRGQLDDAISPSEVYAIEVYERKALVPIDFLMPSRMGECGVIAVWTKGFVGTGR